MKPPVQAKDISDELAFEALAVTRHPVYGMSHLSEVQDYLAQFPPKVVLAKLRRMIARGILRGCGCGCRGDFELPKSE